MNIWRSRGLGDRSTGALKAVQTVFRNMGLEGRDFRDLPTFRFPYYGTVSGLRTDGLPAALTDRREDLDNLIDLLHRQDRPGLCLVPRLSSRSALFGLDGWPRSGFRCRSVRGRRFRGIRGVLGKLSYLALQFRNPGPQSFHGLAQSDQEIYGPFRFVIHEACSFFPSRGEESATRFSNNSKRYRKTVAIWRGCKNQKARDSTTSWHGGGIRSPPPP